MKVSLSDMKNRAPAGEQLAAAPAAPPVVADSTVLGVYTGSGVSGERRRAHVVFPYLQLVGVNSKIREEFKLGHFVANKESDYGDTLKVVVKGLKSYLQEVRDFDEPALTMPRRFNTEAEAFAAGFTTEFETNLPRVDEACDILLIVAQNPDVDPIHFAYDCNKVGYTPVMYSVSGGAWWKTGKILLDASQNIMSDARGGLSAVTWELSAVKKAKGKQEYMSPVLRKVGATPAELKAWIDETFAF